MPSSDYCQFVFVKPNQTRQTKPTKPNPPCQTCIPKDGRAGEPVGQLDVVEYLAGVGHADSGMTVSQEEDHWLDALPDEDDEDDDDDDDEDDENDENYEDD